MSNAIKFRVILLSINKKVRQEKAAMAMILAATFDVPEQEAINVMHRLPVILFDNITAEDIKVIKDRLIFVSKMGLDFNITFKPFPEVPRTGWQIKIAPPTFKCPSCGEEFIILRTRDLQNYIGAHGAARNSAPPKAMPPRRSARYNAEPKVTYAIAAEDELGGISAELEEVEVLSEELEAIVKNEDTIDEEVEYIEEVESISEEMRNMGSISAEMESIGSLSAEFEEIEGVSAEFDLGIGNPVGALSAEEISAEMEPIESEVAMEKIKESSSPYQGFSNNYEGEDIEAISAELQKIAEPEDAEIILDNLYNEEQKNFSHVPKGMKFSPGNYDVMINFSGKGNIRMGMELLARIQGKHYNEVAEWAEHRTAIVVANHVSKDAAESILKQFQN